MPHPSFSADSFLFLQELAGRPRRSPATTAWFAANRRRYEAGVRDPFKHLLAEAQPWLAAVDPGREFYRSRIHGPGGFTPELWAQFGDARGPQLFARIADDFLDFGFSMWSASAWQRFLLRKAIEASPREFWRVLEPLREHLSFEPDADEIARTMEVGSPESLVRWAGGAKPRIASYVRPGDPLLSDPGLGTVVTRALLALHRFAAATWEAEERAPEARGVFISYRRSDSAARAGRLHDWLRWRLEQEREIFFDVTAIAPGSAWRSSLTDGISRSRVTVAVIGPDWAAPRDDDSTRLGSDGDIVTEELRQALALRRPVLPVLVGGASLPDVAELPEPIRGLADAQAFILRDDAWEHDVEPLLREVERLTGD